MSWLHYTLAVDVNMKKVLDSKNTFFNNVNYKSSDNAYLLDPFFLLALLYINGNGNSHVPVNGDRNKWLFNKMAYFGNNVSKVITNEIGRLRLWFPILSEWTGTALRRGSINDLVKNHTWIGVFHIIFFGGKSVPGSTEEYCKVDDQMMLECFNSLAGWPCPKDRVKNASLNVILASFISDHDRKNFENFISALFSIDDENTELREGGRLRGLVYVCFATFLMHMDAFIMKFGKAYFLLDLTETKMKEFGYTWKMFSDWGITIKNQFNIDNYSHTINAYEDPMQQILKATSHSAGNMKIIFEELMKLKV